MKVVSRPSFDEVVASLDRKHALLCAASAELIETISYLDRSEHWGDDETSLDCFLSARYGVASGTAFEWAEWRGPSGIYPRYKKRLWRA